MAKSSPPAPPIVRAKPFIETQIDAVVDVGEVEEWEISPGEIVAETSSAELTLPMKRKVYPPFGYPIIVYPCGSVVRPGAETELDDSPWLQLQLASGVLKEV